MPVYNDRQPNEVAQIEHTKINIMKSFIRLCRPVICGLVLAALVAIPSASREPMLNAS